MKNYLAPSLMCCDLLNIGRDLKDLEQSGMDWVHFDIMDTTFTTSTMLPAMMLKKISAATSMPMDVHIMSVTPELYFPQVLPYCAGGYVSVHAEGLRHLPYLFEQIRQSGAKVGLALNASTPLTYVEENAHLLDMVVLMNVLAGVTGPRKDIDIHMEERIRRTRDILNQAGRMDAIVSLDGNASLRNSRLARQNGANAFVLGTSSIFRPDVPLRQACRDFRKTFEEEDA